jgi:hypothetical protein
VAAASYAPPPFRHLGRDGRDMIKLLMNQAVESGLTVVRRLQQPCRDSAAQHAAYSQLSSIVPSKELCPLGACRELEVRGPL